MTRNTILAVAAAALILAAPATPVSDGRGVYWNRPYTEYRVLTSRENTGENSWQEVRCEGRGAARWTPRGFRTFKQFSCNLHVRGNIVFSVVKPTSPTSFSLVQK